MPRVTRSAFVPFSAREMFDLVCDIERYPHFLPWCRSAAIRSRTPEVVVATLEIARGPIHKSFTTRNLLAEPDSIRIELVDGPFSRLDGYWDFKEMGAGGAGGGGCEVGLVMDFEIAGRLFGRILSPLFEEIARTMVDAFCHRAHAVHGGR
ncbi:type II toxin-antitoxin system RatA family toxin [Thioalkalivibrio sp. HK1]|uniref:type II toxin-antitoxin system RatA family toxin n=1 Tax=Thioalkalivibrio sp. HK1 TaxID=1469245 RepID=UPI000471893A|nr:type II toxin-antitoxin system RatA family toxin [Thioalkalivibrio sp. HK1]